MFYHTFCTLGAFRLRETSYHKLKPCKLQWFLHLRVGPPAKTIGNRSENFPKTKQNKMRLQCPPPQTPPHYLAAAFCFVLFCWLARVVDQPVGPKVFPKTKQNAARMPSGNRPDLTKNQPRFVLFCFVGSQNRPSAIDQKSTKSFPSTQNKTKRGPNAVW